MPYQHLSEHERDMICHMKLAGQRPAEIARRLGRSPGTISRELRRNRSPHGRGYFYDTAQRLADKRRVAANQRYKLDDHAALGETVRQGLRQHWSPEQISERLQSDHPGEPAMRISHEAIYQWVYRHRGAGWHERLRRRRPRRKHRLPGERGGKRGRIPDCVSIEQRPAIVDERLRLGDWESDTMEGAKGKGLLVTHVERKSGYAMIGKLDDKRASTLSRVTRALFKDLPASLRRTTTCDNGKEFADFKAIEKQCGLDVYFAHPHSPWERGTNENTNGLLRDFFPKGTDLSRVSRRQIAKVQRMLNNRPRKRLNYRTPTEVLSVIPGVALRN